MCAHEYVKHVPARFSELGHDKRVGTQHGPEAGPGAATTALMGRAAGVSGTEGGPGRGEHRLHSLQQDPAGVEVSLIKEGVFDARHYGREFGTRGLFSVC